MREKNWASQETKKKTERTGGMKNKGLANDVNRDHGFPPPYPPFFYSIFMTCRVYSDLFYFIIVDSYNN